MNIFRLDDNPEAAARMVDDTHVHSQIKENAQMLSTAVNIRGGGHDAAYNSGFVNHPTTRWVREKRGNYRWTYDFTQALYAEKVYRHGGGHASWTDCVKRLPRNPDWLEIGVTRLPPVGTPATHPADEPDPVEAYRWAYAQTERSYELGREPPEWYVERRREPARAQV